MNFKKSSTSLKEKNKNDLDNSKDYPTIADLMREQEVSSGEANTVHHRRDLDALS